MRNIAITFTENEEINLRGGNVDGARCTPHRYRPPPARCRLSQSDRRRDEEVEKLKG